MMVYREPKNRLEHPDLDLTTPTKNKPHLITESTYPPQLTYL